MTSTALPYSPLVVALASASNRTRTWVAELALVTAGAALVALSAQVIIPLPFTPVPLTGQTFAVLLVGAGFGSRRGLASLCLYLLIGVAGFPVFAGGAGGAEYLTAPTAGYLIGMVAAASLLGRLAERGWDRRPGPALGMMALGSLVIYAFGLLWLGHSLGVGPTEAFRLGALPFLPGDIVKLLLASAALPLAWRLVNAVRGGRE